MNKQKPKIVVSEKTKEKLDKLGSRKETYDDIIKRLIRGYKK